MIKKEEDALAKKYGVKKFPHFVLVKPGQKKPIVYEGETYTYSELFEFINIYSETFVFVGDQEQKEVKSAATKTWLNVATPYLTSDSANDICLQRDGTLCVIHVVSGAAPDEKLDNEFNQVKQQFVSRIERGITFNFMKLDASKEPMWAAMFSDDLATELPMTVVMNPGKRKRFLKHEGAFNASDYTQTLDKILGGDAKFKAIKDNKLPDLTSKYEHYLQ